MTLKEFLEKNPVIDKSQFAKLLWPFNKSARSKLSNKLNENVAGTGKQRITDNDIVQAKIQLKKIADDIYNFISK